MYSMGYPQGFPLYLMMYLMSCGFVYMTRPYDLPFSQSEARIETMPPCMCNMSHDQLSFPHFFTCHQTVNSTLCIQKQYQHTTPCAAEVFATPCRIEPVDTFDMCIQQPTAAFSQTHIHIQQVCDSSLSANIFSHFLAQASPPTLIPSSFCRWQNLIFATSWSASRVRSLYPLRYS